MVIHSISIVCACAYRARVLLVERLLDRRSISLRRKRKRKALLEKNTIGMDSDIVLLCNSSDEEVEPPQKKRHILLSEEEDDEIEDLDKSNLEESTR